MNENLYLGIELGSTRIKAVLINSDHDIVASGNFTWESRLENGCWTYSLDEVWEGIRKAYESLILDFGESISSLSGIGISAMMHGYLPFDAKGELLTPFRTWRNTTAGKAARILTEKLQFMIPERWSAAHLYQAIIDHEEHVGEIAFLTTLSGYVHYKLTGRKVLGVGDAAGMFPVDGKKYNKAALERFRELIKDENIKWDIEKILPEICMAGETAGKLTDDGARLLDPSGTLKSGIPFCPPEGDAGTGMVATCSVSERTGNVSAGTSVFAMIVLEKPLTRIYPEIDIVATPDGKPVAMVHCNNCTSDTDAWIRLFNDVLKLFGTYIPTAELYTKLYQVSEDADDDCGGLLSYNYYSGEPITKTTEGRPLFVRFPGGKMSISNFMQSLLYSSVAALKIGMDILYEKENIRLDRISGHGGFFKTDKIGQSIMASALRTPVSVLSSAGEGGAWGIAVLCAYSFRRESSETLSEYLQNKVFKHKKASVIYPNDDNINRFDKYIRRYKNGIKIELSAAENLVVE